MNENSLRFALCPHAYHLNSKDWDRIAIKLSGVLKKDVKLIIFESFDELSNDNSLYDLYYANPDISLKLLKKNYIIVGKLKGIKNHLCGIVSNDFLFKENEIRVALQNQKYFFLPLLSYPEEHRNFKIIFAKNQEDVIKMIENHQADIGFLCTQDPDKLIKDKKIKIIEKPCLEIPHFVLIHPSLEKFYNEILSLEAFERICEEEIKQLEERINQIEKFLEQLAYKDFVAAINSSPNFGIIIYHEKIIFFNEYAKNLLGYTDEELYRMDIFEILHPEDISDEAIINREKRLKGEKFHRIYDIRFRRKNGTFIYVECLTNTILFKGFYCGLVVFYDITNRKLEEKSKQILIQINQIITSSLTEEEIYSRICQCLVEIFKFKFAWVGILDERIKEIVPKYKYGNDEGLLCLFDLKGSKENVLAEETLLEGEITINEDLRNYAQKQSCAYELVKRGFLSSCTIPFFKSGKTVSLLKIYSETPQSFNLSIMSTLKEIQKQISFALERVERIRHNTIISEAIKNSDTWILVTDENGKILYVNEAVERLSGYSKAELLGKNPRIFKSGLNPPEFYKEMWDTITSGKIFNAMIPNRKKNGEIFHIDLKIIPLKLPGDTLRFVAVARDITEEIRLSERVQKLQNFDALTGLLNMKAFAANVTQKLEKKDGIGLLIMIDIYNMSNINKIYGINKGDRVLIKFAEKLKEIFEETDIIARLGADTFGLYLILNNTDEVYIAYSKLYQLNRFSIKINEDTIPVTINASITMFPKDGEDFKILFERADITLHKAKKVGAGTIQFFNPEVEKDSSKHWEVFKLLKKSIDEKLLRFYFQPYYHSQTLEIAGFEALIRIVDREGKIYTPNYFIDYLENSQYLRDVEAWAITEITDKIRKWNRNISVNISGKSLNNPVFITLLQAIPLEIREKLTIEITERVFIDNPKNTMEIIREIKSFERPPKVAIDDFGTGYSSMSYLRKLPVDVIKIDRSFITDMLIDRKSLAIIMTIIDLARRINLQTLAEGIETEEHFKFLRIAGCDYVQGYLFAKPLSEEETEKLILT